MVSEAHSAIVCPLAIFLRTAVVRVECEADLLPIRHVPLLLLTLSLTLEGAFAGAFDVLSGGLTR